MWSFEVTVHQILAEFAPLKILVIFWFPAYSTYYLHPEHWIIIQESVYVLHLITCHGCIMPLLKELLLEMVKLFRNCSGSCTGGEHMIQALYPKKHFTSNINLTWLLQSTEVVICSMFVWHYDSNWFCGCLPPDIYRWISSDWFKALLPFS